MEKEYIWKIVRNLDFIATNICNVPQLLNLLLQESVLNQLEVETIECQQPRYNAGTELAKVICKKDTEKFSVFIRCLNASGNEVIARKLVAHPVGKEKHENIWFGITSPNRFYTGREKEMEILERYWSDCEENKTFSILALTGLGGVGKSELSKNFARWFYKNVKGHCIWIEAETSQSLVESFQKLCNLYEDGRL